MKEEILNSLTMQDILIKYGIKSERGSMFHCPFHGEDRHASAKCYKNSFFCFNCCKTGDFIQFVQYLYNLNFQEAMNKIVEDFNLPIKTTGNYDRNKILEIQRQRELENQKKEKERLTFIKLCKRKDLYNNLIEKWEKQITKDNWEEKVQVISYLQNKSNLLEIYICDKYNIEY